MIHSVPDILNQALLGQSLGQKELIRLLDIQVESERQALFQAAYKLKSKHVGRVVYFRGLVEISNICQKDCTYCGIRRSNSRVKRFRLSEDEIIQAACWAHRNRYGSLVLQGGEVQSEAQTAFIEEILNRLHAATDGELAVTLSLGEQPRDVLRRWRRAGAQRYLLRLETTREDFYQRFHPEDHLWQTRLSCLEDLRQEDYQVGTGVMIGLPGQTRADLADDLLFIKNLDVDMIGMGPFIPHRDTPFASYLADFDKPGSLDLGLKMLACARLLLPDANLAATTALQALDGLGREMGLKAGANIIMPNVTDSEYRHQYQLYEGKPSLDENSEQCRQSLQCTIHRIGETIGYGKWGNSPHYLGRCPG